MGKLVDGQWAYRIWTTDDSGHFKRSRSLFRNEIAVGGPYAPEAGRYHLYISHACPWAHRTVIARKLLGLEDAVSIVAVDPFMTQEGWHFSERQDCGLDTVNGTHFLRDVYKLTDPNVTCRVTVPVLWDRQSKTIVNNESNEIVRMFDRVLGPALGSGTTLTPPHLEAEVDALCERFYNSVNNGVYRCGFATTQSAYERAFGELFDELDRLEGRLDGEDWLVGGQFTEADIFLFTTLYRFDAVYFGHFKCNRREIRDYPNLYAHTQRVHAIPGVSETCHLDQIVEHYYRSHESINPKRIMPQGPRDFFPVSSLANAVIPVPGHAEPPTAALPDGTPLTAHHVQQELSTRAHWRLDDGHIARDFDFPTFPDAFEFLTHVARKAELFNHHPEIRNSYTHVSLRLRTHDVGSITALDFALADAIDAIRR